MKAVYKLFVSLFLAGLLVVVAAGGYVLHWSQAPMAFEDSYYLEVPRGQSLIALSQRLERQGIINARLLLVLARLTGRTQIKAGEYWIAPNTSPVQLLSQLIEGNVIGYYAQILEGWTFDQALQYLHSLDNLEVRLSNLEWPAQRQLLDMNKTHPEGWFFPDTYRYQKGDSDVSILKQAYAKQQMILDDLWQHRSENLPYKTPYDALIMASIVEKETSIDAEREAVAGVFIRRLHKRMRLQTDPTVIYGLGSAYQGNLRRKHLTQATPYNTYMINGLPPTPIALAGERSLYASLHPDQSGALYFVAKGDGYHQFSATLEEHNAAVDLYQRKRRTDYRSTPDQ